MMSISQQKYKLPIPQEYICPVANIIMINPIICSDGYTYDYSTIMNLSVHISPITGEPLTGQIIENKTMKHLIDNFVEKNDIMKIKEKDHCQTYGTRIYKLFSKNYYKNNSFAQNWISLHPEYK